MENIERILAGLIILALLTLLILIAFPVNRPEPGPVPSAGTRQEANRTPPATPTNDRPTPSPAPSTETRTEQRSTEETRTQQEEPVRRTTREETTRRTTTQEETNRNTRVNDDTHRMTEERASDENANARSRGSRTRRAVADRDVCGTSCDCCCGRERRTRTADRRYYRRDRPVQRYVVEPDDDGYWEEVPQRSYRAGRNRPYWAQLPPGVCPE